LTQDWENKFARWSRPPTQTEETKCNNAVSVIRNAINNSPALNYRNIEVVAQGSYRNNTNVRQDSDVDVCVLCHASIFFGLPDGTSPSDFGLTTPAEYSYPNFKNDVEQALAARLGRGSYTRGNKAFNIHENRYRVDSDVVACFEYRRYQSNGQYLEGTAFDTDNDKNIINWPKQNYDNGVDKNRQTGRRFKRIVRILKCLRNEMVDNRYRIDNSNIPSYLIECLVWNVPNEDFGHNNYTGGVRDVLAHLFNKTRNNNDCGEWGEVNELKYLFRTSQPWDRTRAHRFVGAAWDYIGFE